jgi:hypothetical protein
MAPAAKLGDSQMMSFMGFSQGWCRGLALGYSSPRNARWMRPDRVRQLLVPVDVRGTRARQRDQAARQCRGCRRPSPPRLPLLALPLGELARDLLLHGLLYGCAEPAAYALADRCA